MKTIIRITKNYYSTLSYDMFKDDLYNLVNDIDIFCEVKNNNYENIVEDVKKYESNKEDYKNQISVNSIGYVQSEWQEYIIYHNLKENDKKNKKQLIRYTRTENKLRSLHECKDSREMNNFMKTMVEFFEKELNA